MKIYRWKILGLCEIRWKDNGNHITGDGYQYFYSGETKYHINGIGFMIHKSINKTVIEFTPISSRICNIRITAKPLNIFIIQLYSPTSDYTDEQMENFYSQLQCTIDSMKKKDIYLYLSIC